MASPISCWICRPSRVSGLTSYKELLDASVTKDDTKNLKKIVKIAIGGGQYKEKEFDALNEEFMQAQYPNAKSETYHWPSVFTYVHPGESSDVVRCMDGKSEVPGLKKKTKESKKPKKKNKELTKNEHESKCIEYETVQEKRKGEDPEENVFRMFSAMLRENKIPSFVIQGYMWNKQDYNKKLDKICRINKLDKGWKKKSGELDLVVSLPGKYLLSIEVKAACMEYGGVQDVTSKAFEQCEKALLYVSVVNYDLFHNKNIPFIKVAALPNCSKNDFSKLQICKSCSMFVITEDDLKNINELYNWYGAITEFLQSHQMSTDFDGDLHEKVIGRLLGPRCLMQDKSAQTELTFKEITKQYGTVEKIQTRWFQFNKKQSDAAMHDYKLLWITGAPGSGKTLLLINKIDELLSNYNNPEKCAVIVFPGNGNDLLYEKYKYELSKFSKLDKCVLWIEKKCDDSSFRPKAPNVPNCNILPKVIKRYQERTKGFLINIFIDESDWLLKGTKQSEFRDDWEELDFERLGFVWVIQNPLSTNNDYALSDEPGEQLSDESWEQLSDVSGEQLPDESGKQLSDELGQQLPDESGEQVSDESVEQLSDVSVDQLSDESGEQLPDKIGKYLPGFKNVYLKHVMRMSKETVLFVSHMLGRKLISGHGVAGHLPVLYRMVCICRSSVSTDSIHCFQCILKRQALLILKILKDFKVSWKGPSQDRMSIKDFAILMTETHTKYVYSILERYTMKFHRERNYKDIMISYSSYVRGCEKKIVVVDLSDPAIKIKNLMECLTRCLSQLILMDTGIDHPDNKKEYDYLKDKISTATDQGLVAIKDIGREEFDEEMKFILK